MLQESIVADFSANEFKLASTAEPDMCSDDPTRVLLRQMMGCFAQYERTMIVRKMWGARVQPDLDTPRVVSPTARGRASRLSLTVLSPCGVKARACLLSRVH